MALRTGPGASYAAVLADDEDHRTLGVVESVVPTRWADNPRYEQTFWLLWRLADRAKLALGAPDAGPVPITDTDLRQVLNAIATSTGGSPPELPNCSAELAVEPFNALVGPPLAQVMQLATDLVAGQFKDDKDARLERIILTGKTTALQQVRNALSTHFGKTINWDATGVTVESRYAKLATAIGACWAESVRQFAFDPEGAVRQLREGKTVLDVDIENLFFTLPCTFAFRELEAYAARIPSGERLYQLDEDNLGKARSDDRWEDQLSEIVTVYRIVDAHNAIDWGDFKYRAYINEHEPDAVFDPAIWPAQIRTELEVTQNLDLSIHLCRGKPHYVVNGPWIDVVDAIRDVFGPEHLSPEGGLLDTLPGDILVDSLIAGFDHPEQHDCLPWRRPRVVRPGVLRQRRVGGDPDPRHGVKPRPGGPWPQASEPRERGLGVHASLRRGPEGDRKVGTTEVGWRTVPDPLSSLAGPARTPPSARWCHALPHGTHAPRRGGGGPRLHSEAATAAACPRSKPQSVQRNPLMTAAQELLGVPASELGAQLRYGLSGLRAALAAALVDHPDDPARRHADDTSLSWTNRWPWHWMVRISPARLRTKALSPSMSDPASTRVLKQSCLTFPSRRRGCATRLGPRRALARGSASISRRCDCPNRTRTDGCLLWLRRWAPPTRSQRRLANVAGGRGRRAGATDCGHAGWRTEVHAPADREVGDRLRVRRRIGRPASWRTCPHGHDRSGDDRVGRRSAVRSGKRPIPRTGPTRRHDESGVSSRPARPPRTLRRPAVRDY